MGLLKNPNLVKEPEGTGAYRADGSRASTYKEETLEPRSAATAALLGLALVLLGGRFVVTQALEVSENACLGDLALETAQGRFDAFVFADGDLGHEALWCSAVD